MNLKSLCNGFQIYFLNLPHSLLISFPSLFFKRQQCLVQSAMFGLEKQKPLYNIHFFEFIIHTCVLVIVQFTCLLSIVNTLLQMVTIVDSLFMSSMHSQTALRLR